MGLMWTKGFGGKHAGKTSSSFNAQLPCLMAGLMIVPLDYITRTFPLKAPYTLIISHIIANSSTTGGGVVIDKHGARRAPFRFSFKGLNCFK